MRIDITDQARLIASLAETMTDNMWGSEMQQRCDMIVEAIRKIREEANRRSSGER